MTFDSWLSAADGDASGMWFMSFMARLAFPESFVWGELAAISPADTRAAKRYFAPAHAAAPRSSAIPEQSLSTPAAV